MRFVNERRPDFELTYDDVFMVPQRSDVASRLDVDMAPADRSGATLPLIVANMTAVVGQRMAETVARRGALAVLPQDIPLDVVEANIAYVKSRHPVFETPIVLGPTNTVQDALNFIYKRAHGAVIVVDADLRPLGVFTERDGEGHDRFTQLHRVMSKEPLTFDVALPLAAMFDRLAERRLTCAPVLDKGALVGVVTRKGALRSTLYRPALDAKGRLRVAAAVGINGDVAARVEALARAGADLIVVDSAHGHQTKMLEAIERSRKAAPHVPILAGNVVTAEGTRDVITAGADLVKVGVGPGAMCTTRMMTGVGRPQFSAVLACAEEARRMGKAVCADGGIRHPRDVALAVAAGATTAMVGSWFAGTFESAADSHRDTAGRLYKENFGMASARAVRARTQGDGLLERARKELFEEGISTSRMYIDPARPGVEDLIDHVVAGVRSACTYSGARSLEELHAKACVGVQTRSGYDEGRPVPQSWSL